MVLQKSNRQIKHIVVHCSATKEGYPLSASDINKWHVAKGWNEIGYNYVIDLDGKIEFGRDVHKIPAQVQGFNKHAIGVCYIGGVDQNMKPKDTRTPRQKESLLELLKALKKLYPNAKILGHKDFPNVKKACPSFNAKKEYENL